MVILNIPKEIYTKILNVFEKSKLAKNTALFDNVFKDLENCFDVGYIHKNWSKNNYILIYLFQMVINPTRSEYLDNYLRTLEEIVNKCDDATLDDQHYKPIKDIMHDKFKLFVISNFLNI